MTEQGVEQSNTEKPKPSLEEILKSDREQIKDFLRTHTAYELLPDSGKVVVIDVGLSISSAFQALVENGMMLIYLLDFCFILTAFVCLIWIGFTSAPLWDGKRQDYSGMLTVTDFVELFIEFYQYLTKDEFEAGLDIVTIREWNRTRRIKAAIKRPEGEGQPGGANPGIPMPEEKPTGFLL